MRRFSPDKEIIEYVRRLAGCALTGLTSEQAMNFFWGIGANGRSTVLELIQQMPGDYDTTWALFISATNVPSAYRLLRAAGYKLAHTVTSPDVVYE